MIEKPTVDPSSNRLAKALGVSVTALLEFRARRFCDCLPRRLQDAAEAEAQQLFETLNRQHWRGRLPRYRVIFTMFARQADEGQTSNYTRTIMLRRGLGKRRLRRALLHEMCHIGPDLRDAHGPRFLRKIQRLVARGELCLCRDLEQYATPIQRELVALLAAGRRDLWRARVRLIDESAPARADTRRGRGLAVSAP